MISSLFGSSSRKIQPKSVPFIHRRYSSMSYARYAVKDDARPALAVVTGGRSGIGKAIAIKIASLPFIDHVLLVSRSITPEHVAEHPKCIAIAADVGTSEGRQSIVDQVQELSAEQTKALRFLVHSAGTIDPIKSVLELTEDDLRTSMVVNLEAPLLLTTALYPYLASDDLVAGRVLHVSSGAAHGPPPVGWAAYGISKAAFFQSFQILDKEFVHLGGKVRVGSFKPGVVDTAMQGVIREAPQEAMPAVGNFQTMKDNVREESSSKSRGGASQAQARPPPKGALDSPDNVAYFAEWLLLGTEDDEFANRDDPDEYDVRNADLYPKWIPPENLPKEE
jgi:benzil reductase ((S)-benzoin forming)